MIRTWCCRHSGCGIRIRRYLMHGRRAVLPGRSLRRSCWNTRRSSNRALVRCAGGSLWLCSTQWRCGGATCSVSRRISAFTRSPPIPTTTNLPTEAAVPGTSGGREKGEPRDRSRGELDHHRRPAFQCACRFRLPAAADHARGIHPPLHPVRRRVLLPFAQIRHPLQREHPGFQKRHRWRNER